MTADFEVLLFAGDINVYSVARAFNEAYGIKPYVYGKYHTFPCANSTIMHYTANPDADQQDTFLKLVNDFSDRAPDRKLLVIGCGDSYVQLISANRPLFPTNVIAPYISIELMNDLIHKEKFYARCEKSGIPYPATFVHRKEMGNSFELPFREPFIIKPSNGIEYWRHPYPTQKKVYKADSRKELENILTDIYQAGYDDSIIIQDFIPGDDTFMRVLTSYSDRKGKVRMMCLGHVLLEEHTPHGIGNHAVIITENDPALEESMKKLLEEIGYVGFANFDIKYDQRDGVYKVFEINTRQGRSNYYVTGAGENIAKLVVKDYIDGEEMDYHSVKNESLWMVVPKGVAFKYIEPEEYKNKMRQLIRQGKFTNPLINKKDRNLLHQFYFLKNYFGHFVKYKKYLGKRGD